MDSSEWILAVLAGIFLLGTGAQWLAWRVKLPAILLLLIAGCAAGSEIGFLRPQELFGELLLPFVSLAVGLVLYEGSLNLRFRELKGVWSSLLGLLTVGVAVSWCGGTLGGMYAFWG
ncbi:MAG: cation:proton antiporter [Planctomycetaceae bacterium]|nr:cation:proton antiporter [Planctomycetaceae bacterium]